MSLVDPVFLLRREPAQHRSKVLPPLRGQQTSVKRLALAHPRLVLVHGPAHARWLNPIEIDFSSVQRRVLTPNDFPCLVAVAERLANFERDLESIARRFGSKFTRAEFMESIVRIRTRWAQNRPFELAA